MNWPFPSSQVPIIPSLKIYVLQLEYHKWYVGKTPDVAKRFQDHMSGKGAVWTRIYKPIKIEKVIKNASDFDEDRVTKEYMAIYGIDNVRGGSYCQEVLDDSQRECIKRELWSASGACLSCGRRGHFANACKAVYDVTGRLIGDVITGWMCCSVCEKSFSDYRDCMIHQRECKVPLPIKRRSPSDDEMEESVSPRIIISSDSSLED